MRLLAIAVGLSLLGGFGGLAVASALLLFGDDARERFVPALVSYAVGALLGVALLELLPQALAALDARSVLGTSSVGSLKKEIRPGDLAVPHDFLSLWDLPTFHDDKVVQSVAVAEPNLR